jgi:hypothetical protein
MGQMILKEVFLFLIVFGGFTACMAGPYAPAAGQPGSTAIEKPDDPNDTSVFAGWADGWCDYIIGTNVIADWQTPQKALGVAKGDSFDIVCLGRGGRITLTFSTPIANGPGWDFATFENSVNDTFLELGYVEVSSDGVHFVRFDNYSQTASPVWAYGGFDPTDVTGYCSKYRQGFGTPFDLQELAGAELLDITRITHIRIVDIVGDGTYLDTAGNPIYDPYPANGSAGVDLDAIGVLHQKTLEADINGDGIVNLFDFAALGTAWQSGPESSYWNHKCDLEPFINDFVDIDDMLVMISQWLMTETWYAG